MYNSFGELHDRRWLERRKHLYVNPEEYKKHLKKEADKNWEEAKTGGISKEMSKKEAIRKRQEEAKRRKEEEAKKKLAEEKRLKALGPNFPKVWDLNYFREDTQKIFKKLSSDKLD